MIFKPLIGENCRLAGAVRRRFFGVLATLATVVCCGAPAFAQTSVSLVWDRSTTASVTGYKVYTGTSSRSYAGNVNVGNATTTTLTTLTPGVKYYFAVTAYDSTGMESDFSNEISYTPTASRPVTLGLTFAASAGTLTAPFTIVGGNLTQSTETTSPTAGGRASYTFNITNAGDYIVNASVLAPDSGSDSVFINIDGEPTDANAIWDIINTATLSSQTVTWRNADPKVFTLSAGAHELILRGREADVQIASFTIQPYGVTPPVTNPPPTGPIPGDPPKVAITAPNDGITIPALSTLNFVASVVDLRGHTISKVQFLNGATVLGESTTAPYTFTWASVPAGTYDVVAKVYFESGTVLSGDLMFAATNNSPTTLPTIALTAPANGSRYGAPATIPLAANVTANSHSISKVQYFTGSTLIGESSTAPYRINWSSVGAGNYQIKASLVYDSNQTVSSAAVGISVTNAAPVGNDGPIVISLPVASATVSSPFSVRGGLISQTSQTTSPTSGGRAVFNFTVTNAGDYIASAQLLAPNQAADSFFINIDSEPTDANAIWDLTDTTALTDQIVSWRNANPKVFSLSAGAHQLIVRGREANAQLGDLTLYLVSALPQPWISAGIGTVATGSSRYAVGAYLMDGAGTLSSTVDSFQFSYQTLSGDGEIIARVNSLENTGNSAFAGVMVRESLQPGSASIAIGIGGDNKVRSLLRAATGAASSSTSSGTAIPPTAWVRMVRNGTLFTTYQSTDGQNWTKVDSQNLAIAGNAYFGLAVCSGSASVLNTASFTGVIATP